MSEQEASLVSSLPLPSKGDYTPEFRYEVVSSMLMLGNQRLVAALHKVPYDTITRWKRSNWWAEAEELIKHEKKVKLSSKLEAIVDKALDVVQDRLENGETVVNLRTGQQFRKPVNLQHASRAAADLMTRKAVIEKQSEETTQTQVSIKETLNLLANEFAKMARKEQKDKAEEIEYVEGDNTLSVEKPEPSEDYEEDIGPPLLVPEEAEVLLTPLETLPKQKPIPENDNEPMANPPRKLRRR